MAKRKTTRANSPAERERLAAIETLVSGDWSGQSERVAELRARAVRGDITLQQLRAEMFDVMRAFVERVAAKLQSLGVV